LADRLGSKTTQMYNSLGEGLLELEDTVSKKSSNFKQHSNIPDPWPDLKCDICGAVIELAIVDEEVTNNYEAYRIGISGLRRDIKGMGPYQAYDKQSKILCLECYNRIMDESETFSKASMKWFK
jgi:hypothetical protein